MNLSEDRTRFHHYQMHDRWLSLIQHQASFAVLSDSVHLDLHNHHAAIHRCCTDGLHTHSVLYAVNKHASQIQGVHAHLEFS